MKLSHQPYFEILNQYYDKIYVITIPRAKERQEKIKSLLHGLNYAFFMGIDKKDWTKEKLIEQGIYDESLSIKKHRYHKPMSMGNIAVSYGHTLVYEDVIKHNYQRVLIFEDDVVPDFSNLSAITAIFEELPKDWELLYWGYDTKHVKNNFFTSLKKVWYQLQRLTGTLNWNSKMIKHIYAAPLSTHISKAGFHDYTHAYAITQSAARKLKDWNTPVIYNPDTAVSYAIMNEKIKAYICHPIVFLQEFQLSDHSTASLLND